MIFCMKININVFYELALSFLQVIIRLAESCENSKCVIYLHYLQKKGEMKLIFWMQIDNKLSCKLIPLSLVVMVRLPPPKKITQNSKFGKSLQYLKKEVRDKVDFLYRWISEWSINWYYHFWWARQVMPKVFKISII